MNSKTQRFITANYGVRDKNFFYVQVSKILLVAHQINI